MKLSEATPGELITVKHYNYFVLAFAPVDAAKYPNTARFSNGKVYMRRGIKGHVYAANVDKNNNVRIDRPLVDCGAWTQSDVEKLIESIK